MNILLKTIQTFLLLKDLQILLSVQMYPPPEIKKKKKNIIMPINFNPETESHHILRHPKWTYNNSQTILQVLIHTLHEIHPKRIKKKTLTYANLIYTSFTDICCVMW